MDKAVKFETLSQGQIQTKSLVQVNIRACPRGFTDCPLTQGNSCVDFLGGKCWRSPPVSEI